jgi:hypothetical protein
MDESAQLDLTGRIQDLLATCIRHAFRFPIHFSVIAVNGSTIVGRYEWDAEKEDVNCTILSEHTEPGELRLPINLVFCDSNGEAARALIANATDAPRLQLVH